MGGLSITALLPWPAVTSPPPITDIAVCFTVMASVITARFLEKTQHMLQYLCTIVGASRNFDWISYDAAFHRQAAGTASFN